VEQVDRSDPRVALEIDAIGAYYYAASNRSVVRRLVVRNLDLPGDGSDIVLRVFVESALDEQPLYEYETAVPAFLPGDERIFTGIRLAPNHRVLALLEEQLPAYITVTTKVDGVLVGVVRSPITFLAHNQWMHRPEYFDSLAAFVQPNSDAVQHILTRAGQLLKERTGSDATEGYQCLDSDPGRVVQMVEAIYDALREVGIRYTNPPASFEGFGQKVRTPDIVAAERAATCLDSTVLLASCVIAIGLDAFLVLVDGHAFVTVSTGVPNTPLDPEHVRAILGRSVIDNRNEIAMLVRSGLLLPVESTMFTTDRTDGTFAMAVRQNQGYFTNDLAEPDARGQGVQAINGMVNVLYARKHGIPPLPTRKISADQSIRIVVESSARIDEPAPVEAPIAAPGAVPMAHLDGHPAPARVRSWLRSLLDLSFTNPLLRIGGRNGESGVFHVDLPSGVLSTLEDRLVGQGSIDILPATKAPAGLRRDPNDAAALKAELVNTGRIYSPSLVHYERDTAQIAAQHAAANPELPPAKVGDDVADFLAGQYSQTLDRTLSGLKRRAREVEAQTGANTLFLTIGTLSWHETLTVQGRKKDDVGRGPLFLIPVRITGKATTAFRITPDESGEMTPNYCLLEKLRQTYGLVMDELERPVLDDTGIDVDRMIATVREALGRANISNAVVTEDAYLAVLNFSTFRLWKDMREHWSTFVQSPVVTHLVERPNEQFDNPADLPVIADPLCPIEADQSQLDAVRWAVEGRSFVLEGPPGTGKSQTIANLLSASIAAGKKVLFVAEKQAALGVVKQRLDRVGLSAFCLDLHDKGSKPEQIRAQIKASLDFVPIDQTSVWNDVTARLAADESALAAYRDALHGEGPTGHSAWTAQQELEQLGDGPSFWVPPAYLSTSEADRARVKDALLDLPRVAMVPAIDPSGPWALCDQSSYDAIDRAALADVMQSLTHARATLNASAPLAAAVNGLETPLEFEQLAAAADLARTNALPAESTVTLIASPQWTQASEAGLARLDTALADQAPIRERFRLDVYDTDLSAVIAAGLEAAGAGMLTRGRRTRAFAALVAPLVTRPIDDDAMDLLPLLQRVGPGRAQLDAAQRDLAALPGLTLPAGWSPFDAQHTDWVHSYLAYLPTQAALLQSPAGVAARGAVVAGWLPDEAAVAALRTAAHGWQQLISILAVSRRSAERWRGGRSLHEAWSASEAEWQRDPPRYLYLQRWCDVLTALRPLDDVSLGPIADAILSDGVPLTEAHDRYLRGFLATVLQDRLEVGRIDRFDGQAHDRRLEDFMMRDQRKRLLMRDQTPAALAAQRPVQGGRRVGKWGALEQELERKSRRSSIRKLITDYGDILPDLTPCFLMSPDSVARFIPPGSITFDLVVFDEASQIEVAQAIGAMGRAKATVIVGDSRQMPPSRFGGGGLADPDLESTLDDTDETLYEDLESILSECVESNLPRLYLECHYRSHHEALIAFSNHHFYEDRLTTFPSPIGPRDAPVRWVRVDGRFDRQAKDEELRTNRVEAQAVVDEIVRRVNDPSTGGHNIAVVTLNAPQQQLILRLLDACGDERVRAMLDDESEHGLIVRNLESVQGDERDVVMLSVGFAPPVETKADGVEVRGRLALNFGPLNKRGGERRLNVAVTRARDEMLVFCSFDPEEMRTSESSSVGIQLLKAYLSAAMAGPQRSGDQVQRTPTAPDLHRTAIATALRERGLRVQENVGLSSFRIDIAVAGPDDDEWLVAVLLDGPGWAARRTVFDRDALPSTVLRNAMGWARVERIWFPSWTQEPDAVLARIERAVSEAREEAEITDPPPAAVLRVPS
jgi:hypothetical protein